MPAPIAVATGSGQGVSTVAVTVPAATAVGELILIRFATNSSTTITTPAGYTVVQDGQNSPQTSGLLVSKVAAGGDAGSSVSVTFGASSRVSAVCTTWPAGSTVDAQGGTNVATSSTTFTSPAVTTVAANCTVLIWDVEQATGTTAVFTGPAGFTTAAALSSLAASGNNNKQGLAWLDVGPAGTYGPYSATWDVTGTGRANTVAIAPPAGAPVATATATVPATVGLTGTARTVMTATATTPATVGLSSAAATVLTATASAPVNVGLTGAASTVTSATATLPASVGLSATASTVSTPVAGDYRTTVLADSPTAFWRLGEAPGSTTMADASGNGRSGAYLNSPTLGVAGLVSGDTNTAMSVVANANGSASVPSAAWMDTAQWSAEVIVALTSDPDGQNGDALVSRYTAGGYNWLIWRNTSGAVAAQANVGGTFYNVTGPTVAVGARYHVVATHDGSDLRLYVNGQLAGSTAAPGTIAQGASPIEIGRYSQSSDTTPGGTIDEVAVYGTALSATRVAAHYASGLNARYAATVLGYSPALYLQLDEASGTTAVDSSGNGRSGTYVGSYTLSQPSLLGSGSGGSVSRTATSSRIEVPAGAWSTPTTGLTATALVNLTAYNYVNAIFARDEAYGGGDRQWVLYVTDGGGFRFIGSTQTVFDYDRESAPGLVVLNRTYHVAMVWDVSAGTVSVYLDGALAHTFTDFTGAARTGTNTSWSFGNISGGNAGIGWGLTGRQDEVAVFMSALSAGDIATLGASASDAGSGYQAAVLTDAPAAYLRMNEAGGSTATDSSGFSRNGAYGGTYTLGVAGLVTGSGTAVSVNGGYAAVPYGAWMNATAWSVEAWFKPATTSGSQTIASRYTPDGFDGVFHMRLDGATLNVYGFSSGALYTCTAAGVSITAGTTYHAVATYDGANLRVYVDGQLRGTVAATGVRTDTTNALSFGRSNHPGVPEFFNGVLDECAFYTTALSGARVAAHYSGVSAPTVASATATLPISAGLTSAARVLASATATLPISAGLTASAVLPGTATAALPVGVGLTAAASAVATASATLPVGVGLTASGSTVGVATATATLPFTMGLASIAATVATGPTPPPDDPPPAPDVESNLQVSVATSVVETPAWLDLSVSNATAESGLEFFIDGDLAYDVTSDDAGQAVGMSVPLTLLAAGTHDVQVRDVATGRSTTVNFEVQLDPAPIPTVAPAAEPPTPRQVVNRWSFEQPGGEVLTFPTNPARMSNPHAARVFNTEHTTSPHGQPLTFEGEPVAVEWSVEGTCLTQAFYEALERFQARAQRFYAVDHLDRVWVVTFEALDWTQLRDPRYPWGHTYRARLLIYAGPLEG